MTTTLHTVKHELRPDADWMVFIHGAGGSVRTWRRQLEDFGQSYNLLLIDLPDHGESKGVETPSEYSFAWLSELLWETISRAGLEKVYLVGLSLGSILALDMERMKPERCHAVVLGGAITRLDRKLKVVAAVSLGLARIIGFRAFYRLAARIALPRKNHQKSREVFVRESRALTTAAFEKWTAMYTTLNQHLEGLFAHAPTSPTVLIMGQQDHLFGKQAQAFSTAHTNAQVHVIAGCGHVVSIEKPQAFNRIALAFAEEVALVPNGPAQASV